MTSSRRTGVVLGILGASLWGLGAVAAQALFARGVSPVWLTATRMAGAGVILLIAIRPQLPGPRDWPLVLGISGGLAAAQYLFFATIDTANVAIASFLQYLSAPMIACFELARGRRRPGPRTLAALAAVLVGTALLLLGGSSRDHRIAPAAVALGALCALSIAIYTLLSARVVAARGAWSTTTLALAIGSVPLVAWYPPWTIAPAIVTGEVFALTAFITLFGTILATGLYLASLRHVQSTEAAVISTIEAVTAALASSILLDTRLVAVQYAGAAAILAATVSLCTEPTPSSRARSQARRA